MIEWKVGDKAPDFNLKLSEDKYIKLSDMAGKYVVLYFYPKDDTPGCTVEANEFNKHRGEFDKLGAVIIGVSKDSVDSHEKFKCKYDLGFHLGSDEGSDVCEKYGVWTQKSMFGKKYMGINRATFLIDKEGKIAHIWPKVSVLSHASEVLNKIKMLKG